MKHIKLSRLSDRQLRRLINRAEVRFASEDWGKKATKDYYKVVYDTLKSYYDYIANDYMRGNGFSSLLYNIPRLQKYNPRMAKGAEKFVKDFDERRKKLLMIVKPYIDEVQKRMRERA